MTLADFFYKFAAWERETQPRRLALCREKYPDRIAKCEVCEKRDVVDGGLCPACWEAAAAIIRKEAK